ncbi:hypothetical protein [Soonwooa purpurea]
MEENKYNLHDVVIKNININRREPGIIDSLEFTIEGNNLTMMSFSEVYWCKLEMNFGIIADESILEMSILDKSDSEFIDFLNKWKGYINVEDFLLYKIELNSSGSIIKIISKLAPVFM